MIKWCIYICYISKIHFFFTNFVDCMIKHNYLSMNKYILNIVLGLVFITLVGCGSLRSTSDNSVVINKTDANVHRGENQQISVSQSNSNTKKKKKNKKKKGNKNDHENNTKPSSIKLTSENINGEWVVYSANNKTTSGDDRPYVIFDEKSKQMYANNGCNTLNANYSINGDKITFVNLLSTQRYCASTDAPLEYDINNAFNNVKRISISEKGNEFYMSFLSEANQTLMVLRKANTDFISGIWKITKVNNTHCKNKNLELALDLTDMKLHGNVGCNTVNGEILLDASKPNSIMFLDLISTKMACPDLDLESEILIALEKVEKYNKEKNETVLILRDKEGNIVLELTNESSKYLEK